MLTIYGALVVIVSVTDRSDMLADMGDHVRYTQALYAPDVAGVILTVAVPVPPAGIEGALILP